MMNPWLGMAIVVGTLTVLMLALRVFQRVCAPHPELLRKLLHMGMGLLTLSFPWLFNVAWPIVVLACLSAGAMLAMRLVRGLRSGLGSVVAGVSRTTLGEVYFPIAVAILFVLYLSTDERAKYERQLLYCIPILLLTLADAMAALVGIRYGHAHYETSDGKKSVEGSFAFFLVAFFCSHVPLLLFTDLAKEKVLLIGLLLAWLAMMFEAISWAGIDNLALPLVSYLLLKTYLDLSVSELLTRLAVTAALTVFALCYCGRSTLIGSAVLGVVLVGYICWALGDWPWLVPPLTLFLTYTLLSPPTPVNTQHVHNIHAVICVASAGLVWLFLSRIDNNQNFLYLYTLSFAAQLAIIGVVRLGYDYPHMPALSLLALCSVQGWLLLFLPYLLTQSFLGMPITTQVVTRTLLALPAVAAAAGGFFVLQPEVRNCSLDTPRWLRQAGLAGVASVLGLVPLYLL